jgi:hypothetical protein
VNFTWTGSSADWSDPAAWGETSLVPGAGDDVTIDATGSPYTVTIDTAESFAIADVLLDSADATLALKGTLTASGTLSLEAGTLSLTGTLVGGTIVPGAATILYPYDATTGLGSTLDNVSFAGTMAVAESSYVWVAGTLGLFGAHGGPGLLTLACVDGSSVGFTQSAVLDNATVDFSGPNPDEPGALEFVGNTRFNQTTISDTSNTLTLGSHLLVEASGGVYAYIENIVSTSDSDLSQGVVVNAGTISTASAYIGIEAAGIVSTGTILVGQHGTVGLDAYYAQTVQTGFSTVEIDGLVQITRGGDFELPFNPFFPVTGTGEIEIGAGSSLAVNAMGTAGLLGPTIDFAGADGTLALDNTPDFYSRVVNFTTGDLIIAAGDVTNITYNTADGGELLLSFSGAPDVEIPVTGTTDYATARYTRSQFTQDQSITTDIGIACYRAGTRIAAPDREVLVEALRPGELVLTLEDRVPVPREVHWVGMRCVDLDRHPAPWRAAPIRIVAHAFAPDMPRRDLLVSPDHALLVDGVLMQAQSLLNGATVMREPAVGRIFYYHVELDRHAVLLAEGLPAESYLDTGNRGAFENGGQPTILHPDFALGIWREQACAPLVLSGPLVHAARRRLIERLPELGHATTTDPALCVLVDGGVVQPQRYGAWLCVALPDGALRLRLRSRVAAPVELHAGSDDTRRLGVAVQALMFDGLPVALDDARLAAGWHASERELRWTDGDAWLEVGGIGVVELCLAPPLLRYHARAAEAGRLAA